MYEHLKYSASRLGAAFQKINFLRDLKADFQGLGRTYFPNVTFSHFNEIDKQAIEEDIEKDFRDGMTGIRQLPKGSRFGVYVAYIYYYNLFEKIKKINASRIMEERIRISNSRKYSLFMTSYIRNQIGFL